MANLESVISAIFRNQDRYSQISRQHPYNSRSLPSPTTTRKYMEVPINSDIFELPLLASNAFMANANKTDSNMIVARLYSCGLCSTYKSLDSIMKDVLSTFLSKRLCKIHVAGTTNIYYATFGAVFDATFKPLMMLSWIIEKKTNEIGIVQYFYKRPLLRLDPSSCINKDDALQKFLAGKMLTASLNTYIEASSCSPQFFNRNHACPNVKVEIDRCPFVIKSTDTPSISVTNEGLLQLAANHIDEVF